MTAALVVMVIGGCNKNYDETTVSIYSKADLISFRDRINDEDDDYSGNINANLMVDIDLAGEEWIPIGEDEYTPYYGVFKGNGHTISNLTVTSSQPYKGLFGFIAIGEVYDLTIENPQVEGGMYVGGVVGKIYYEDSRVQNCSVVGGTISGYRYVGGVAGDVSYLTYITNCSSSADVSGFSMVGGVVGHASTYSPIANCYNTGSVSATDDYVGGVTGYVYYSSLTGCYNTGSVTGGANHVGGVTGYNSAYIVACYNTGDVSGVEYVGGVAGFSNSDYYEEAPYNATIAACYSTGVVSGSSSVGGVVGRNGTTTLSDNYYVESLGDAAYGIGSAESSVANEGTEPMSSAAAINTQSVVDAMNLFINFFEVDEDYDDYADSLGIPYRYEVGTTTPQLVV